AMPRRSRYSDASPHQQGELCGSSKNDAPDQDEVQVGGQEGRFSEGCQGAEREEGEQAARPPQGLRLLCRVDDYSPPRGQDVSWPASGMVQPPQGCERQDGTGLPRRHQGHEGSGPWLAAILRAGWCL